MVERSLSMREAPGSIPGLSIRSLSVRLGVDFCSIFNKILRPIKFKIFLKLIEVAYKFTLNTLYCIERQLLHCNYTVGLVVEYSPATGETRVQFPDGVLPSNVSGHFPHVWVFSAVVARPLCMRKAAGSNPARSISFPFLHLFVPSCGITKQHGWKESVIYSGGVPPRRQVEQTRSIHIASP